ncbi:MAG: hypothetical protein CVV07_07435 [Gammaproteobacteria bacterium HGW-Gammaproteobacteria-11]|nr:MAG: hypothetical protein CVV07_07435 [Gammaproteobacteria bacterium HGW-Gammaproteobacteria-11]
MDCCDCYALEVERDYAVTVDAEPDVIVITDGEQGPPGVTGEPGPAGGSAIQRVAGVAISALQVVYEASGAVYPLSYLDDENIEFLLGIALTAADQGNPLNIQRSGVVNDSAWSWTPGPVWLGANGALTQTPPSDGFDVAIGVAVSATRLNLNLQFPIELE